MFLFWVPQIRFLLQKRCSTLAWHGLLLCKIPAWAWRAFSFISRSNFDLKFLSSEQSVFVFLVILSSGVHYVVQRINYRRDLARIERFVSEARSAAWGPRMVPLEGKRKVRTLFIDRILENADCDWVRFGLTWEDDLT